jgi:IrrE N-terminal-like domain
MMRDVAQLERAGIGLTQFQPLNPYDLAAEHGIEVYPIEKLVDGLCPETSVRHFTRIRRSAWSAALIPIGSARVIVENTAHSPCRRRSSIAHELGHHLLEHDFDDVLLIEDGCRRFDAEKERQARFLSGELLIPWPAAIRAAFDAKTNLEVARAFGVSEQFAQMQMAGPRVLAQRALVKQSRSHPPYAGVSRH